MSGLSLVAGAQVIDLISLKPFDMEAISKSIKKTRHAIVVEECMKTGGIGASLSAIINESLWDELDHQVRRHSPLKLLPCPVRCCSPNGHCSAGQGHRHCRLLCSPLCMDAGLQSPVLGQSHGLLSSFTVSMASSQGTRRVQVVRLAGLIVLLRSGTVSRLCAKVVWPVQVVRLSSQDVPTAYAYELEAATIVQPEQVVEAVQRVVGAAVPA